LSLINRGRIHLSIDIESTAGPTLLVELGKLYSQEQVLVYDTERDQLLRLSDIPRSPIRSLLDRGRKLFQHTPLSTLLGSPGQPHGKKDRLPWIDVNDLPSDTAAIHGHFVPDRFDSVLENPFMSLVLREPLERAVAQFLEWKQRKGNVRWRLDIPYQKEITFRDFALRKDFKNFQFKSLGDKRLGDFDLVGITACLDGFVMQLHGEEPHDISAESSNNQLPPAKYKKINLTDELREEFKEYNKKDYDLYFMAKEFMGYCD